MTTQRAQLNYLRMAPRKVRAVADLIRGLTVNEAEAQLMYMRRRAAKPLLKLLRSAAKNAETAKKMTVEKLYVETVMVDQGPMLKRYLPRARGMATPIQKKMSHVTMVLGEKPDATPRYKIVVQKKVKKAPEESKDESAQAKKRQQGEKGRTEERKVAEQKKDKPGVLKRIFRRKAV